MTQARSGVEPAEKPAPPPPVDLSKANVQQVLEQQAIDIATRRDEIRLRRREIEVGLAYAEKALAAQERDLHSTRCEQRRGRRDRYLFLILALLIVVAFFTIVLKMGKDAFAAEALKAILFFITGGTGGYFAGRQAQRPPSRDREG